VSVAAGQRQEPGKERRGRRWLAFLRNEKTQEVCGVLAGALALFALVALFSFDPRDPSFFQVGVGERAGLHNWGGRIGAEAAGDLLGLLGVAAILVPPVLGALAWRGVVARPLPRGRVRGLAVLVLVPSLCLLASLLGDAGFLPAGRVERPGGFLGDELRRHLQRPLGTAGLTLGALTGLILAGVLWTERRLVHVSLAPLQGAAGKVRRWPGLAARAALGAARTARDGVIQLIGSVVPRRTPRPLAPAAFGPSGDSRGLGGGPAGDARVLPAGPSGAGAGLAGPVAFDAARSEASADEGAREGGASRAPGAARSRARGEGKKDDAEAAEQAAFAFLGRAAPYQAPPLSLLDAPAASVAGPSREEQQANAEILERTLRDFGVEGRVAGIYPGPVITRFEIEPAPGVKIQRIVALADDLALALKAMSVRVVAPIPGKAAVGVEIPNRQRAIVYLKEVLASREFKEGPGPLPLALGKEIEGSPYVAELSQMPHLLIAGATGSGKSVCINALILSLLARSRPEDARLVLIDPKRVELSLFNGIPHLVERVVVDAKDAARRLQRVVAHMEERYRLFAQVGTRNLQTYNALVAERAKASPAAPTSAEGVPLLRLPMLVVIIDELADLMLSSPVEVETAIQRIAQLARAVGIHLIVATQRPSVDVITGVIKANLPARISFQVSSKVDSRTILDMNGAEQLLGMGDMLYIPPATSKPIRIHGCKVTELEARRVVEFLERQARPPEFAWKLLPGAMAREEDEDGEGADELYREAVDLVVQTRQASISMLQRRLRVGFNRAARMIERMEQEGIVSAPDGAKPREVLREAQKP
jgi:S-DNA-T family DNA segregation ATPase FtsK/SpoIIIE